MALNILDRFCDTNVTSSPLPLPHYIDMLLSHCCYHFPRYQKNPVACEQVTAGDYAADSACSLLTCYVDVGAVVSVNVSLDLAKLALAPDKTWAVE